MEQDHDECARSGERPARPSSPCNEGNSSRDAPRKINRSAAGAAVQRLAHHDHGTDHGRNRGIDDQQVAFMHGIATVAVLRDRAVPRRG